MTHHWRNSLTELMLGSMCSLHDYCKAFSPITITTLKNIFKRKSESDFDWVSQQLKPKIMRMIKLIFLHRKLTLKINFKCFQKKVWEWLWLGQPAIEATICSLQVSVERSTHWHATQSYCSQCSHEFKGSFNNYVTMVEKR